MEDALFGRLPPELRNQVYQQLLPEPTTIRIDLDSRTAKDMTDRDETHQSYLALASTCKTIHREAMSLYYHTHRWHVTIAPFYLSVHSVATCPPTPRKLGLMELQDWLKLMGKQAVGHMSDLHICIKGNLAFLDEPSIGRRHIETATAWLARGLREVKDQLSSRTTLTIHLCLPLAGRRGYGLAPPYHDVEVRMGDVTHTIDTLVDRCIDAEIARHHGEGIFRHANGLGWKGLTTRLTMAELDRYKTASNYRAVPMKWYIKRIAG